MALVWSLLIVDPLIVLSTIFCGSVSAILAISGFHGRVLMKVARAWARSILIFAGVRVQVEGLEKLDPNTGYVFVANHLSYMDTPVVLTHVPVQFRFLAKQGLFKLPFLGTYLRHGGHISVPIGDARASVKSLTLAAKTIREQGISVLIFPEGGRSFDGVLKAFKDGAAFVAIKAGVPLVPMTLIGTRAIMAMHSKTIRPGKVRLRIGDPIPTLGMTSHDREALTETARQAIVGMQKNGLAADEPG
ncbi:MAG: lysophospholipid acyltransferase family protein [Bryobacteraceae bacterium]